MSITIICLSAYNVKPNCQKPVLFGICTPPAPTDERRPRFFSGAPAPPLTPRPPQIAHPHQRTTAGRRTGNRSGRATDPPGQAPRIHAQQNARKTAPAQTAQTHSQRGGQPGQAGDTTRARTATRPRKAKPSKAHSGNAQKIGATGATSHLPARSHSHSATQKIFFYFLAFYKSRYKVEKGT